MREFGPAAAAIGAAGAGAARYADEIAARHRGVLREAADPGVTPGRPGNEPADGIASPAGGATSGGQPGRVRNQEAETARPALSFELPPALPLSEDGPAPSQTTHPEGKDAAADEAREPASADTDEDARAVTDRVYELMRQEVLLARQRGVARGRDYVVF